MISMIMEKSIWSVKMKNPLKNTEPKYIGKFHRIPKSKQYYLHEYQRTWEIRQNRFKSKFLKGREHPHDVVAVASSKKIIMEMYKKYLTN